MQVAVKVGGAAVGVDGVGVRADFGDDLGRVELGVGPLAPQDRVVAALADEVLLEFQDGLEHLAPERLRPRDGFQVFGLLPHLQDRVVRTPEVRVGGLPTRLGVEGVLVRPPRLALGPRRFPLRFLPGRPRVGQRRRELSPVGLGAQPQGADDGAAGRQRQRQRQRQRGDDGMPPHRRRAKPLDAAARRAAIGSPVRQRRKSSARSAAPA